MAFVKKTWIDRVVQYANRRLLTKSGGEVEQVTVTRDEGTVSVAGDKFDAATMNDLENRIYNADTNMKTYVDGRTPINNGGHATDLSTTGLSTGTYLYNYDNTTNGTPKANTEGDCYITINNTQSYGCELAVSNSGLYWRAKNNQVWGNWEDIIGKLTVDSAISTNPVDVNDTYQIPTAVLNHSIIVITFRRYSYGATCIVLKEQILGGVYDTRGPIGMVTTSMNWSIAISNSGLITMKAKADSTVPYIEVFGYL